jgi:hypothetical protein
MGVPTLLTRLPGGDKEIVDFPGGDKEIVDFSKLKIGDEAVAFDAGGVLMQFARHGAGLVPRISPTHSKRPWQQCQSSHPFSP